MAPTNNSDQRTAHRDFLNRYYGVSRWFYDLTRRYYLLGREEAIKHLAKTSWQTLVEVGPGTGRNLAKLHEIRPTARYGGVEVSDAMIEFAKQKVPFASIVQGFAEDADIAEILGERPDRILFAYCLSMVQEPRLAVEHARRSIAENGEVVIVDFGDLHAWNGVMKTGLRQFLEVFHVMPLPYEWLEKEAFDVKHGLGGYWSMYRFKPLPPAPQ